MSRARALSFRDLKKESNFVEYISIISIEDSTKRLLSIDPLFLSTAQAYYNRTYPSVSVLGI
jgi:hypothetical protein